jgi:hypothetical protein
MGNAGCRASACLEVAAVQRVNHLRSLAFCDSQDWLAHGGTAGRAVRGEMLILDDGGDECPAGTPGTVWFRGATDFEYFNGPAKTAESRNAAGDMSMVGGVAISRTAVTATSPAGSPT